MRYLLDVNALIAFGITQHQFHQRVVRRHAGDGIRADWLHDEHVGAADRLLVTAVHLAAGEGLELHSAELPAEIGGDLEPVEV